jgi:YegS/Rv2252/BmrU family lipid kinase
VKVHAILNPRAGVAAHRTRAALERGRPGWQDYALSVTRAPDHATELAREAVADGADAVLAVGGDGTVNEVARGLLGTRVSLGIVPVGSGNGLARALGIPLRPAAALAALETATRRTIDVGFLNGRPFLNVAGAGFDAAVGHAFHERGKQGGRRGLLGYVHLSLRELRAYRAPRVVLEVEGGVRHELYPFVLTFANGPQYGSGAVVNPGARLDDGVLEIVLFEDGSRLATLAAATRLFLGGIERLARYRRFAAARATVTATAPLPLHVDGDPIAPVERVEVELRPRALWVLVPQAAAGGSLSPGNRSGDDSPSDQEQAASARSTSDRISSRAEGGAGSSGERT